MLHIFTKFNKINVNTLLWSVVGTATLNISLITTTTTQYLKSSLTTFFQLLYKSSLTTAFNYPESS